MNFKNKKNKFKKIKNPHLMVIMNNRFQNHKKNIENFKISAKIYKIKTHYRWNRYKKRDNLKLNYIRKIMN